LFAPSAHIEHVVVSNVKKIIPDSVETWWREYRQALREAKWERMGEHGETDVIYHGVEEAEQRSSQEGASEYQKDSHFDPAKADLTLSIQAWPRN
jgi:hypothetical protein